MALRFFDSSLGKNLMEGEQESAFKRLLDAIQDEFEDLQTGLTSAEQVLISLPAVRSGLAGDITLSLQEYLEPLINSTRLGMVPSGVIVPYYGDWADAVALVGWAICNGTSGTPDIVGSAYRYIRFVTTGVDAGAVGGCDEHTHDDHTAQEVVDAVGEHAQHAHAYSGTTDSSGAECHDVDDATDFTVVGSGHQHNFSGNTDENPAGTASTTHAPTATDVEHADAENEPPYRDYIPIMKL